MQRELAFVEAVLAPALGSCCRLAIAEAQPVPLPPHLLQQQQQGSWKLQPGAMALLLPDVTLLDAGDQFTLFLAFVSSLRVVVLWLVWCQCVPAGCWLAAGCVGVCADWLSLPQQQFKSTCLLLVRCTVTHSDAFWTLRPSSG
jgi:hypothetical protein